MVHETELSGTAPAGTSSPDTSCPQGLKGKEDQPAWTPQSSGVAAPGSVQLELRRDVHGDVQRLT